MISNVLTSTKTLTGRLALFFGLMAVIVSAFVYVVFVAGLYMSEDRVGERRILIDRDYAVRLFQAGESGELRIDDLTIAYNDPSFIPAEYYKFIKDKESFIGEVGEEPESRMVYVGEYTDEGETFPIILLSEIDLVELDVSELMYATTFVLTLLSILIFGFGALLYRLSKRLIEPFNSLSEQLESNKLNLNEEFDVSEGAAVEFRQLTDQLNQYRREINSLIKREQAFARYSSHELRTPLTVARGANKLLLRSETTEFQSRQVERIDEAIIQMSEMVDALLGLVRYERNSDDAPLRLFSQQELETIVSKNSLQADEKQVEITLQVQSE
ncbi:sensor histidine kinase, partial [Vibrio alginolyticus]|uniref:sensor histidine kinase n=1 Tax=Vibrio alginolyticus TaxID=663 RepID=UPI00354FBA91